MDCLYPGTF
jgi:microtubule-associated protein, RP/EB family